MHGNGHGVLYIVRVCMQVLHKELSTVLDVIVVPCRMFVALIQNAIIEMHFI